ncbi:hypothetical protein [Ostreibacterium oceani]|uniref:Uncharacterized protein n=1 Tax=Ostreibacterium oceani TaxID=2654998 RepID=A0A6N7EX59_9GAMM|nr:hypothetical protein [Ostreibacterium oceani]MPV86523.1 hypothetical protein [Ostreibacterium oceani]
MKNRLFVVCMGLSIGLCMTLTNVVLAQQGNVIIGSKEEALKQCELKALASPPDVREQMYSACLCIVEHTDFARALELYHANDVNGLQQLYAGASQACAS